MDKNACYQIIGISPSATLEQLKEAYRKGVMKLHPDRAGGNEEKFKNFKNAYEFLCKFGNHVVLEKRKVFSINDFETSSNPRQHPFSDLRDAVRSATVSLGAVPWQHAFFGTHGIKKGVPPGAVFFGANGGIFRIDCITLKNSGFKFKYVYNGPKDMFMGDIITTVVVDSSILKNGGWVQVMCPFEDTDIMVRIPAGSTTGKILKVKGKGYWNWKRQAISRGDLYLTIK